MEKFKKQEDIGSILEMKGGESRHEMKVHVVLSSTTNLSLAKFPYRSKILKLQGKNFCISNTRNSSELLYKFVISVGVDKVYDLKIPFLGGFLVDNLANRIPHSQSSLKYIEGGYWLNTHGSVVKKIEQIQEIARRLDMDIEIEVGR